MTKWMLILAVLFVQPLSTLAELSRAEDADLSRQDESTQNLARLIEDLNSGRYLTRERATRTLSELGRSAFGELLAAANGEQPEAADRAIWILQSAMTSEDEPTQRASLEHLVQVEGRPLVVTKAALRLAQMNRERAIKRIEAAGGLIVSPSFDQRLRQHLPQHVVLDRKWQGGDEGLREVAHMIDIQMVRITGAPVTVAGLLELAKMPLLRVLHLYDVELTEQELKTLEKELAGVVIDWRRGALLGVSGDMAVHPGGGAKVTSVRENTAAEAAGIRVHDVITKLDDTPIRDFGHLRNLISRMKAGDEADFVIKRGDETLDLKVKFGSWLSDAS